MTSKLLGPRANAFVARWGVRKSLGLKTSMDLMKATHAALACDSAPVKRVDTPVLWVLPRAPVR